MANNNNKETGGSSRRKLFNTSKSDQSRAHWSEDDTTRFLELIVVEKNNGNWSGKSPTVKGYENIVYAFQQMRITLNKKQLKSKCESLRKEFHLWGNMFNGQTGGGYDLATGTMTMADSWWDCKIQVS